MKDPARLHANISLGLDRFALEVDLETHAHVTGLFGPSGAGKTSFLECVAGLRHHASGTVCLGETAWQDSGRKLFLEPEKRGIGYVPQDGLLFPHRSVRQNLTAGFRRALRNGQDPQSVWDNVVAVLELDSLLDRDVRTLSGGERQRVALGRALCSAPRLMLLDEPLAALDQPLRQRILPFLRRVRQEFDVPMILVSHDPIEVQALCDDVVVLGEGRVIARGAPAEVLTDPAVFPIASEGGFENIVPCDTVASDDWMTTVHLGAPPTAVVLKLANPSPGPRSAHLVGIPARDVLVATEEPAAISARNVLAAEIVDVQPVGSFELVKARLDPSLPALAVEVGRAACAELGLAAGKRVFLIIKAMSCTLYEEERAVDRP